jgi:hypothetical protein
MELTSTSIPKEEELDIRTYSEQLLSKLQLRHDAKMKDLDEQKAPLSAYIQYARCQGEHDLLSEALDLPRWEDRKQRIMEVLKGMHHRRVLEQMGHKDHKEFAKELRIEVLEKHIEDSATFFDKR